MMLSQIFRKVSNWRFWQNWPWMGNARAKRLFQEGIKAYVDGRYSLAAERWETARLLFKAGDDHAALATCENSLGNVYKLLGQPDRALQAYERALSLHELIGDEIGKAADLANAGTVYQDMGNWKQAEELASKALTIYQSV
jgi:tetratricopeptide (TPR) repeat protein